MRGTHRARPGTTALSSVVKVWTSAIAGGRYGVHCLSGHRSHSPAPRERPLNGHRLGTRELKSTQVRRREPEAEKSGMMAGRRNTETPTRHDDYSCPDLVRQGCRREAEEPQHSRSDWGGQTHAAAIKIKIKYKEKSRCRNPRYCRAYIHEHLKLHQNTARNELVALTQPGWMDGRIFSVGTFLLVEG